jgi:hypothetical protein
LNVVTCTKCKEVLYAGQISQEDKIQFIRVNRSTPQQAKFFSFKESNEIFPMQQDGTKCSQDSASNVMYMHTTCPSCDNDSFKPLSISDQFILPLIAETMLIDMPEIDKGNKSLLPAQGRRLIAFSDSRSAAARLGPLLTNQHERQMYRYMIYQTYFSNINTDNDARKDLITEIEYTRSEIDNAPNERRRLRLQDDLESMLAEVSALESGKPVQLLIAEMQTNEILKQIFNRPIMSAQGIDDQQGILYCHINLAEVALSVNDYLTTQRHLDIASEIAKQTSLQHYQPRLNLLFALNALKQKKNHTG